MTNPRSWLRPRFSLRVLLLAVTAFAIGFPIWYRWPYEERPPFIGARDVVITWQRQWGGGRVGIQRIYFGDDSVFTYTLRNDMGQKHGPCTLDDRNGCRTLGQYFDDE